MQDLGEAAKMWIELKWFELYFGVAMMPIFLIFMIYIWFSHKNDFRR